ncbi:hypothetical protein [Phocaeicola sp.]|uniref:hypothetical protein n=1 Tax=Phocaeicola sp. TaxID=2773926 RepID=UPI00307B2CB1
MNQIGEFEKVSLAQFEAAMRETYFLKYDVHGLYDDIRLPARATAGSAGYDFFAPFDFTLQPGESIQIPTGIRVRMEPGWFLLGIPKSGLGTKYRLQLDNTAFAIDGDYYHSDNEGHIFVKLTNSTLDNRVLSLRAGDKFVQGIFLPYGITYSDNAVGTRNGGFGSTGR